MSITNNLSNLELKKTVMEQDHDPINGNWESWNRLKLSVYHGKKLVKRAYKPYHPKTKTFYLHELDNFGFEPNEKIVIVMRTLKKVLGNADTNSNRAKRINNKLSFIRVRGLEHFKAGKSIKDLIEFPDSYWQALKAIEDGQRIKKPKPKESMIKDSKIQEVRFT